MRIMCMLRDMQYNTSLLPFMCNLQALANQGVFLFQSIKSQPLLEQAKIICFASFQYNYILFLYREISILLLVTQGKAVSRFSRRYKSLWSCRHELKAGRPAEVRRHSFFFFFFFQFYLFIYLFIYLFFINRDLYYHYITYNTFTTKFKVTKNYN